MSDDDFLDVDPNKLTIPQLKSKLNQLGVELPMKAEKKQVYVDLFTAKQEERRKVHSTVSHLLTFQGNRQSKEKA
jgi:hypothetical protein